VCATPTFFGALAHTFSTPILRASFYHKRIIRLIEAIFALEKLNRVFGVSKCLFFDKTLSKLRKFFWRIHGAYIRKHIKSITGGVCFEKD
jgi:hypothetical protein